MFLQSIASAVPYHSLTQKECWEILNSSACLEPLKERSVSLLEKVLLGNNGIKKRHFAVPELHLLPEKDAGALNQEFLIHAPELSKIAVERALENAEIKASKLDALFVCTCTGYLCPGISSYLSQQLGLRQNCYLQDIVGLGCGAALPTLRSAQSFVCQHPGAYVACVAVEICSAAFYLSDDPGVLISLSLFGDGASATIWSGQNQGLGWKAGQFDTLHLPEYRELIRFENRGGKLCNKLDRSIPEKVGCAVEKLYQNRCAHEQIPDKIIAHGGGRDVLAAIEERIPQYPLRESRQVLKDYGNMSSPSVLIALEETIKASSAEHLWLTSYGAGFAAHGLSLDKKHGYD